MLPSVDRVPVIAEPFFEMAARVEFHPAMNLANHKKDLNAALKQNLCAALPLLAFRLLILFEWEDSSPKGNGNTTLVAAETIV